MINGKLYFNLIHRVAGSRENFEFFKLQQDMAHAHGLKTTVITAYDALENPHIVEKIKEYRQNFGDELGILLTDIDDGAGMLNGNYAFWLFSMEKKCRIIDASVQRFKEVFGFCPQVMTTYYLDAPTICYIKSTYPEVQAVIATCFEEGTKTLKGTNYDCYLFSEGGPWWPWIPSKQNSQCPAFDRDDDSGVVALPHLTRDMLLSIEDRNDYFASHPQNMTRGWVFDGNSWEYMNNFFDMTALQFKYNEGYSYSNMYVDPKWLMKVGRHDDDVREVIYLDTIKYLAELKRSGYLIDMGVAEFSLWFRENRGYNKPDINLWEDILCGSERKIFWYIDSYLRATVDPNQGGAITDLRPYVARLERPVGADTQYLCDGSYPYILHSLYRGGWPAYMSTKSMFTCTITCNGVTVHLRTCSTGCGYEKNVIGPSAVLDPVDLDFGDVQMKVKSVITFAGSGHIVVTREIVACSDPQAEIEVFEFFNGCWGTNEYPVDLRKVELTCCGERETIQFPVRYDGRVVEVKNIKEVYARVPDVSTGIRLTTNMRETVGIAFDGLMTGPMYTIGVKGIVKMGEVASTCLLVEKI